MPNDFNTFYGELRMLTMRLRRAQRDESMTPTQIRDLEKKANALIDGYSGDWLHYADASYDACTSTESAFMREHNRAMVGLMALEARRPGEQSITRDELVRRLRDLKETFIRLDRTIPTRVQTYMGSYAANLAYIEEELAGLAPAAAEGRAENSGCYLATAVYGSYDCEPLWTLRRYRDEGLAKTAAGRAFIHCYYATSPAFVRTLGRVHAVQAPIRALLNIWVSRLEARGYASQPYADPDSTAA
ncbi:hypothetical protein FHE66_02745 [Georgenia sp. 311]|uniref:CFI-box-CTERM domain-containing protein n=1 Tax=Georgenia sp. 311 TaxID=2585134 RepID=UPI00111244C6|nr:CFI-box-CTERM domain-containing protein [Georgenia sp. 311]TNC19780.1 hypothetical protein FHE66_02745 [Georgenia sp. 311]